MNFATLFNDQEEQHTESGPEWSAPSRYRILIVDDEVNVLSSLRRTFRNENYDIQVATNASEALQIMEQSPAQLIISDFKMPGMDGGELLRKIRDQYPDTIRILLTGHADTQAVMAAIKEGVVYRFILKPWNDDDLRVTAALALEQYELVRKNRNLEENASKQSRDLERLKKATISNRSQLAIMLNKRGLITSQQLQQVYRQAQSSKMSVMRYILDKDWVSETQIRNILVNDFAFQEVQLNEVDLDPGIISLVPAHILRGNGVIPLRSSDSQLQLAVADPMDSGLLESLSFATGLTVDPVVALLSDIDARLAEYFGDSGEDFRDMATLVSSVDPYEQIQIVIEDDESGNLEELLRGSDEPPAIRMVNAIIMEALRLGASDIHIQPRAKNVSVRYRIDGVLQEKIQVPLSLLMPIVSRIKVIAELDISERRRPQDGRITVKSPTRVVDLRISTLPTINGEKVVMRVLDRQSSVKRIEQLGFSDHNRERVMDVVSRPQGIILATGPTGSGKTTTLYAMLQHDASPGKNYVTIEDPVEFYVDMAGQVPVRERIGLDFATVLRAILRQDPDVILLGEIRDEETADVAFHAALTGHVVYSTLHTNSATATIARLLDLGLKPYIVASALEAIIAQRLLRRVCRHCREEVPLDEDMCRKVGFDPSNMPETLQVGRGCEKCNEGYSGRIPVHEVLVISEDLRAAITDGVSAHQLYAIAQENGMKTLVEDAREKVIKGETTLDEILRVLGSQASGIK